jgi:hypothetical protein
MDNTGALEEYDSDDSTATQPMEEYEDDDMVLSIDERDRIITMDSCAVMIEKGVPENNRKLYIFDYKEKPRTAFYTSTGTSMGTGLKDTLVPFYGESKRGLVKATYFQDVPYMEQRRPTLWKPQLKKMYFILNDNFLKYFRFFFELQISATVGGGVWNSSEGIKARAYVLSHSVSETKNEENKPIFTFNELLIPVPPIIFDETRDTCSNTKLYFDEGQINPFLIDQKAFVAESIINSIDNPSADASEESLEKGGKRMKRLTYRKSKKSRKSRKQLKNKNKKRTYNKKSKLLKKSKKYK